MTLAQAKQNFIVSRTIDFIVLGCTFYASCLLLSVPENSTTVFLTLVYSTVILISIRLGRHYLSSLFPSVNNIVELMLCNAAGLVAGAVIMLLLSSMIPNFGNISLAVIFASVMAFFVLGTIAPFLQRARHISKNGHIAT